MEKTYTFAHKVQCSLRLLDTTNGRPVLSRTVHFSCDEAEVKAIGKGEGLWVFTLLEPQVFSLGIHAEGFEPLPLPLCLPEDGTSLVMDVHLIPKPHWADPDALYTFQGEEKNMIAVDAVALGDNACLAREYDKRHAVLRLFNPHRLELDKVFYAIVNPDEECFEALEITKRISDEEYRVHTPPQKEIASHFPLARRVLGRVEENGAWRLRLRRSAGTRWVIRYQEKGGDQFETVCLTSLTKDNGDPP